MTERSTSTGTLAQQLQLLSDKFAERLAQELPALAETARLLDASNYEDWRQHLCNLRDQLHKLVGASGTFDFADIGQRASELEQLTIRWLESPSQNKHDLQQFIQQLYQFANRPIERKSPSPSAALITRKKNRLEGSTYRIYILEADASMGENMCLLLGNFGYHAEHFTRTEDFDTALKRRRPDALIIDASLGGEAGQTGLEYAAALQRRLDESLPLLMITAQNDFVTQLEAVRAGAIGCFTRPVEIAKLENHLERCFSHQQDEPYRVLIIDDDRDLSSYYSIILRNANIKVETLSDPLGFFEAMTRFNPEMILLDVNMPNCTGPELAQIIRFNEDWLRIPIIYLSGESDINRQMEALIKAGDDFVTKFISDNALITTVLSRAKRARLLSNALARDSLTGLLKHTDIKDRMAIELARTQRTGEIASVVMLDIDHFKNINDSYGHGAGDIVIRALANLLRQRLRRVDSLGRYGGEEFLVVLPNCYPEQSQRIFDDIRQRFAELRFVSAGIGFSATLSAGISRTQQNISVSELLERVDRALYAAKNNGRNQVRRYVKR